MLTISPEQTRCAVWGSPVAHSLSPVLHRAAHVALGLTTWSYDRREVDVTAFAGALEELDESWRGLSLTMPLKEVALQAAVEASDLARATGAANTLVRVDGGWRADNTDVHGITAALAAVGCDLTSDAVAEVVVVGSGATARSAVAAVAGAAGEDGATGVAGRRVTLMVRDEARAETVAQARAMGLQVAVAPLGEWTDADLVISTVPASAGVPLDTLPTADGGRPRVLLDVVYGEGPTPLQRGGQHRGWTLARGVDMLLHQATRQVTLMTGRPAPLAAMAEALYAVVDPVWGVRTSAGGR
ncbi:shikimate dehydrogenase [Humibacillus xanthopallidus]|uniref:Shikimate dehydrogenase n=1 Tax=Humibacillus xanthopallidus TaxID=412689 RepID=A0A543HJA1_9MICO|nr:shikimate dehydrogenase [Humibacillus xanthopallidus]TQM58349.1 shikimate dehydrogenase [Humibacillus xanthopallidus]